MFGIAKDCFWCSTAFVVVMASLCVVMTIISKTTPELISPIALPMSKPTLDVALKNMTSRAREGYHPWKKDVADWGMPCEFRNDKDAPIPVILISKGRSGSSATWDVMSALAGSRNFAYEITGSNNTQNEIFFYNLEHHPLSHTNWTLHQLCYNQQYGLGVTNGDTHQVGGIAGFQWKPFTKTFLSHEYALQGLRAIGQHNAKGNTLTIKVVHTYRNIIDRLISGEKKKKSNAIMLKKENREEQPAHCAVGDEDCIRMHAKTGTMLKLPTHQDLLQYVETDKLEREAVIRVLEQCGLDYLSVQYENLFDFNTKSTSQKSVETWMKVFQYLGRGPANNLTAEDVQGSFSMAPTHGKSSRSERVSNYDEVKKTLVGTEHEYLLQE